MVLKVVKDKLFSGGRKYNKNMKLTKICKKCKLKELSTVNEQNIYKIFLNLKCIFKTRHFGTKKFSYVKSY